jgi:hypothetical protein
MQLIIYIPLINVRFPGLARLLFESIISIVCFDLLPTDDLYPVWFGIPESPGAIGCLDGEGPDKICRPHFIDFDYGSTNFVVNLGSLFIAMNLIIIQYPIYFIAKCL